MRLGKDNWYWVRLGLGLGLGLGLTSLFKAYHCMIVSFIKFCGFITFLSKVLLVPLSFSKSILLFFLKHFVVVVCCCSIVFLI